jgi:hypothetical protein
MKTFSPARSGGRASAVGIVVNGRRVLVVDGGSGVLYAYDRDGKSLFAAKTPDEGSFLNDIVVSGGFAYVTDSFKPIVWRAPVNSSGELALEPWLDLSTQGASYIEKTFNWNGIEATSVPGVLVAVDSASGALFRVDTTTKTVTKVGHGTDTVVNGDGLVVRGTSVWVVRNADGEVAEATMNQDWTNGSVSVLLQSDLFGFPTTADILGKQMLVVNSQFDKGGPVGPGTPTRPFTVSAIPLNRKK